MSPAEREQTQCTLEMSDILNACNRDDGRDLTSDETKKFNRFKGRFDELAELRKFPEPQDGLHGTRTIEPNSEESPGGQPSQERIFGKGGRLTAGDWSELQTRSGVDSKDWNGFRDEQEYFQVLASQRFDPRLQRRASNELVDSDGGLSVPAPLASGIFNQSLESEIVRPRARTFAMTSSTLKVVAWDSPDHSGGNLFGGITRQWVGETASLTVETPKLRATVLAARKFALLGRVSSELAADSPSFAQSFREALVAAAAFHIDDSLLNSNGGSEPEGLLNTPCLIAVPKETAQAAASIVYANIVSMWSRMFPPSRNNSIWVANSDVIPQLFTMSQTVGTGGVPVFQPASQPAATLFGRPIIFTEKLPSLGTKGDLLLLDLSQYAVGLRADVKLMISPSVYFTTDELAFRLTMRIDGKSLWDKVLTPKNGPTLSPFVALATRA